VPAVGNLPSFNLPRWIVSIIPISVDGRRHHFWTDRLWALTRELPVREVPIDDIAEFDQDCWFHGRAPTCRQVADHARRIQAADLRSRSSWPPTVP
jgi:hypothetical protein